MMSRTDLLELLTHYYFVMSPESIPNFGAEIDKAIEASAALTRFDTKYEFVYLLFNDIKNPHTIKCSKENWDAKFVHACNILRE